MTKCPCCKITNCLTEAKRHPSVTSYFALSQACTEFSQKDVQHWIPLIRDCGHHSEKGRLANWFDVIYKEALERARNGIVVRHTRGTRFGSAAGGAA